MSDVRLKAGSATEVILECKEHKFRKGGNRNPGEQLKSSSMSFTEMGLEEGEWAGGGAQPPRGTGSGCKWLTVKEVRMGMGLETLEDSVSPSAK